MIKRTMDKSWPKISYRESMTAIRGSEDRGDSSRHNSVVERNRQITDLCGN